VAALLGIALLQPAGAAFADSILFIGNSFTYGALSPVEHYRPETVTDLNRGGVGGVPALFKSMSEEAGLRFEVSLETEAGKGLDFHYQQRLALFDRSWDHVILQGYSTLDEQAPGDPDKLIEYTARLVSRFRTNNPRVDVRLIATWSRADQTYLPTGHWFGRRIDAMALDVRGACDAAARGAALTRAVIPVGQAWLRAMTGGIATDNPYRPVPPGVINLWAPDRYHASTQGYYLEALAVFGSVTGRDPRSLGSGERAARDLRIPRGEVTALERIASEALREDATAPPGARPGSAE
jgi:hypothetical protein